MISNIYDFDKTIYKKDSTIDFFKFCLKKKPSILKYLFIQLWYFFLYVICVIDKTKFKSKFFVFLKAFDNIDQVVSEFWKEKKNNIAEWYEKQHQENDIVISASPYFLLKPICDELHVKHLVASNVDSKTGQFLDKNCYGEEKITQLKEKIGDVEINEFYSDSYSDQPLADVSKNPFIVKHGKVHRWNEYKPSFIEKVKGHFFKKEFLAFLFVGFINVLNGIWMSYVFSLFLEPVAAFLFGYSISLVISYFLNSLIVFKEKLTSSRFIKFCISYIPNFLVQVCLIIGLYYGAHLPKILVYALSAIIAIPVTFLVLSLITFSKKKNGEGAEVNVSEISFDSGSLILLIFAANILISSLLFVFKLTISWFHLPLSFLVAAVALFFIKGKKNPLSYVIAIIVVGTIFVVSIAWIGNFYDSSYDGNWYHKFAVGLLKFGWNPLYELPGYEASVRAFGYSIEPIPYVSGYCKGLWFFAASVYSLTGNIEMGKCYNLIFIFAAIMVTYGALRKKKIHPIFAGGFALVAGFNPVLVSQIFTFYIDGALYAALLVLVIYLLMWLQSGKSEKVYLFVLIGASMIVCGNIKFTGLLLGGSFCILNFVIYAIRAFIQNKKQVGWKGCFKKVLPTFVVFVVIAVVTVAWAGMSAYVTNMIHYETPCYPLIGKGAIDIMTNNSPFTPTSNYLSNIFRSLFSRVDNFNYQQGLEVHLKWPFTISHEEWEFIYQSCDTRLSGFGPLFSGVVILCVGLFIYECVALKKNFENATLFFNLLLCVAFVFIIKESWWARYAHYAYIAVLIVIYCAIKEKMSFSPLFVVGIIAMYILLVNDQFSFQIIEYNKEFSKNLAEQYSAIKEVSSNLTVYNDIYPGAYFNLIDLGFNIKVDPSIVQNEGRQIIDGVSTYWIPR